MILECFLLTVTDLYERSLRRYHEGTDSPCALQGYHTALKPINVEGFLEPPTIELHPKSDFRWPKQCACGYMFTQQDIWQVFFQRFYRRTDTGDLMTLAEAPLGAIWSIDDSYKGPDGRSLVLMGPNGKFFLDRPNQNGFRWKRTGEVPSISVTPSVTVTRQDGTPCRFWVRGGRLIY